MRTLAAARQAEVSMTPRVAVRVTAEPTCSRGVKVAVRIPAKRAGAKRAVWDKVWRVAAKPDVQCRSRGTG